MAYEVFKLKQEALPENAADKNAGFRQDLNVRLACPNCPPDRPVNIVENMSDGDLVCGNCGLVLGDRIVDTRSEWRTFANDEGGDDPSRVGGAINSLIDGPDDFSTVVSFRDKNTGVSKELQQAARAVQSRTSDRTLTVAFQEIQSQCDQMNLPRSVSDLAKQLYKRAEEEKALRGKSLDASAAACIFIACRQAHVPRTFKEIVAITGAQARHVKAAFKVLRQKFEGTGASDLRGEATAMGELAASQITASAEDLINRFGASLGLPYNLLSAARSVCNKVTNLGLLTGRSPITVATSCIYFTAMLYDQPKSAKEVADVGGMAESTIKLAYKIILEHAQQLVNPEWVASGKADIGRLRKA